MTCIIIEDEIPAQRILENYISKIPQLEIIASFQSALEANATLLNTEIDMVFLDINLPDISGIQYIRTLSDPPAIIMTTAYHEHAVASFELDTIYDYLVKPFSFDRFLKAVNKVKKRSKIDNTSLKEEKDMSRTLFLNIDKTLHKISIDDIVYIVSDKNYVTVITSTDRYSYLDSLKNWLVKLPEEQFVQIHKSYIINSHCIQKIQGNMLYTLSHKLPIGRLYKSQLLKKLNQS